MEKFIETLRSLHWMLLLTSLLLLIVQGSNLFQEDESDILSKALFELDVLALMNTPTNDYDLYLDKRFSLIESKQERLLR